MNKLRIRTIALALLTGKVAETGVGYNQQTYDSTGLPDRTGHACGTTACIGGHALAMYEPEKWDEYTSYRGNGLPEGPARAAAVVLGLDLSTAMLLFQASPVGYDEGDPNAARAAAVLFHLADTGRVNWSVTKLPTQVKVAL